MRLRETEHALARMEPDTPPSQRYNRLVQIGAVTALEMRDSNEGQGGGPEDKSRHQYVWTGGLLWRRRLPPECVGDDWVDGSSRWEPVDRMPPAPHVLRDFLAEAPSVRVCVVRREPQHSADGREYVVRGEYVDADESLDVEIPAGPITGAWWEVSLQGLCPDCGGDLVWWEAGHVPGTRKCLGQPIEGTGDDAKYAEDGGCGSMFSVGME